MAKHCLKIQGNLLAVFISLIFSLNANAQLNPAIGAGQFKYINPFQYGFVFNDISFVDNKNGLAVGNNGAIAKTTDSGQTWKYIPFKYFLPPGISNSAMEISFRPQSASARSATLYSAAV